LMTFAVASSQEAETARQHVVAALPEGQVAHDAK